MSTVEFHPVELAGGPTPRSPTSGASTSTRCPTAPSRRSAALPAWPTRCSTSWERSAGRRRRAARGMHVYVRIEPTHGFQRRASGGARLRPRGRAAGARRRDHDLVAQGPRSGERSSSTTTRTPATTRWPRPTRCAASRCARVSTPITWDEIDDVDPADLTIATVPQRFAELGDLHAGIDDAVFAIDPLLEWADRDEHSGATDPGEPDHPAE